MGQPVEPREWRGKPVFIDGEKKLGRLEDVYYDAETDEPMFLCVRTGRLSHKQVLVPVRGIEASPDRLIVPWAAGDIKEAPTTKPGQELSAEDDERAFRHYGLPYRRPVGPSGRRLVRR